MVKRPVHVANRRPGARPVQKPATSRHFPGQSARHPATRPRLAPPLAATATVASAACQLIPATCPRPRPLLSRRTARSAIVASAPTGEGAIDQAGAEHGGGYGQGDGVRGLSCTVQVLWTYSARLDNAPWYAHAVCVPVMAFSMSSRVCGLTVARCPEATAGAAVIFGVIWFIGV